MALESMATPLGMRPGSSRPGVPRAWRRGLVVAFGLCVTLLVALSVMRARGNGPEPGVVAIIQRVEAPGDAQQAAPAQQQRSGVAEIEAGSGVRIVRQNGGNAPGGVVITVPDGAPAAPSSIEARVSERTQLGLLPRIADDGTPPRIAFQHPFAKPSKPMIAIVMTGVGIGARGTAEAIAKLPGEVTLAFAPYGRDLDVQVARARREGHEILLQVPMEPNDYPESDPGPHTLRASAPARENMERLHWLMARFTGYVGLMNFMGSRLMREAGTYGTLLDEINRRGLLFLDDGSAPGSQTRALGNRTGLPVITADRVAESGTTTSLEALLRDAEAIALKNGSAVVTIPALPANVERIAAWRQGLSARGLVLAPVSAIIAHAAR